MGSLPFLSRLVLHILDRRRRWDYVWLSALALLPILVAVSIGAHKSQSAGEYVYVGYFDKPNFWPFIVVLPLVLWTIRRVFRPVASIDTETLNEKEPPAIIQLFPRQSARQEVYLEMRKWMADARLMGTVLGLSLMIQIADVWELATVYWGDGPIRPEEMDWSVVYQTGTVSKGMNLMLVLPAYLVQFVITTLGVFCIVYLLWHNLFFLSRVYSRSLVQKGEEHRYIEIDLDDVNKCFGFRLANDAFNIQIIALIIGGLVILLSRFSNTHVGERGLQSDDLLRWPPVVFDSTVFPDVGQWLLGMFWLVGLAIVSLPAIVKLLPRLPFGARPSDLSITTYLREFLTDRQWRYGENPTTQEVNYIAAKFADNDFWPTGDNRASQLFFFSAWVFLIILFPIKTNDILVLSISFGLLGVVAYGVRSFLFVLLNGSLAYVDERLTTPRPDLLLAEERTRTVVHQKIFISYRREDSSAYSRLLRQSLLQFMEEEQIFMDIMAIHDGDDFVKAISTAVTECESMIVMIGKKWANSVNADEEKRLFQADDFVRQEVALALTEGKRVVPVLVGDAQMPSAQELPADLQPLWRRQARELSDSRWEYDVEQLVRALAEGEAV
jgi:hypothetical protein|tara:strand:+ start:8690 stop:10522 length:1833 start_codon:yes stop_codon:yes gene_type:complete